jgi:hypothetical protein
MSFQILKMCSKPRLVVLAERLFRSSEIGANSFRVALVKPPGTELKSNLGLVTHICIPLSSYSYSYTFNPPNPKSSPSSPLPRSSNGSRRLPVFARHSCVYICLIFASCASTAAVLAASARKVACCACSVAWMPCGV